MQWSIGYTTQLYTDSNMPLITSLLNGFVWFCFISILEKQAPKTCHVFFPSGILVTEGSYKPSDWFFGGLYHQSVEYEKTVFQSTWLVMSRFVPRKNDMIHHQNSIFKGELLNFRGVLFHMLSNKQTTQPKQIKQRFELLMIEWNEGNPREQTNFVPSSRQCPKWIKK